MFGLDAEWLFPGHGLVIHGRDSIRMVLTDTARYLRHIIDQVLVRLNAGEMPDDIFHAVNSDPELASKPYLLELYDHPKFIVRNLIRRWGGWWNGNADELLPAPRAAQAAEIAALAGGTAPLVARARALAAEARLDLASHLIELAVAAAPADAAAHAARRDIYAARVELEKNLMARGVYRDAMNQSRAALGEEPLIETGAPSSL